MNARKLARIAIEKKEATQKIAEFSPLIRLLKKREIRNVVEIGTEQGGTLYTWCKIAQPDVFFGILKAKTVKYIFFRL